MDPGTAVGVTSLAIEVCQKLLEYYRDWHGYFDDIQEVRNCIVYYQKAFTALKSDASVPSTTSAATELIGLQIPACTASLRKVEEVVQKISQENPRTTWEKCKVHGQRVLYPFKKDVLERVRKAFGELLNGLCVAVHLLQLEYGNKNYSAIKAVEHAVGDISLVLNFVKENVGIVSEQATEISSTVRRIDHTTAASKAQLDTLALGISDLQVGSENLESETHSIAAGVKAVLSSQEREELRRALEWLRAPDPSTNHVAARKKHEPGTGEWFLQSNEYTQWKEDATKHLRLHGKAGCCKTILCSTIVEDMQRLLASEQEIGFAYFYFSFSDNAKQSYESLLRSVIEQLSLNLPLIPELRAAYEKQVASVQTLENVLFQLMKRFRRTYLIIDALDECPSTQNARMELLGGLQTLVSSTSTLKLLLTSRDLSDIGDMLNQAGIYSIPVDEAGVDKDVELYVSKQLERNHNLRKFPDRSKVEILEVLSKKANGMFRWAFCQLEELQQIRIPRPQIISEKLKSLPKDLDETYERMLKDIGETERDVVRTALMWLAFSLRPLTMLELQEACITRFDCEPYVDEDSREAMKSISTVPSPFISTTYSWRDHEIVQLAHFSVKEYLVSPRIRSSAASYFALDEMDCEYHMAQSCVAYILSYREELSSDFTKVDLYESSNEGFNVGIGERLNTDSDDDVSEKSNAGSNVGIGERLNTDSDDDVSEQSNEGSNVGICERLNTESDDDVSEQANKGSDDETSERSCEKFDNSLREPSSYHSDKDRRLPFLNYARDMWALHQQRREEGPQFDMSRALHVVMLDDAIAVSYHVGPDRGLEEHGQDISLLYLACKLRLKKTVNYLLELGADVNAQGGRYGNSLQAACHRQSLQIVEMLISRGADINMTNGLYGTALQAACVHDSPQIFDLLLERGARINAQGGFYGTALQAACFYGHLRIAEILISRDADTNIEGGWFGTALHAACIWGLPPIVVMLLDRGASVDAQSGRNGTALQAACRGGYLEIARILIDRGADINAQSGQYGTALQAACRGGNSHLVEMLLRKGAQVNTVGGYEGAALTIACSRGSFEIAEMLLKEGAEVNVVGELCGTPLEAACDVGNMQTIKLLVEHGAQVTQRAVPEPVLPSGLYVDATVLGDMTP